jgi:hypothetical protein
MKDLIVPECFNKLQLQRIDTKGEGCEPSTFEGEGWKSLGGHEVVLELCQCHAVSDAADLRTCCDKGRESAQPPPFTHTNRHHAYETVHAAVAWAASSVHACSPLLISLGQYMPFLQEAGHPSHHCKPPHNIPILSEEVRNVMCA